MLTSDLEQGVSTLEVTRDNRIDAPVDIVFEAVLEELGPGGEMPGGQPFPMTLEPWPGGRWFRDLGNSAGHLWGHVQVIKPPTLLEICGPMFMSFPGVNHVQYRLVAEDDATRLKFTHKAMGQIPQDVREGVGMGWDYGLGRIRDIALRRLQDQRKGTRR